MNELFRTSARRAGHFLPMIVLLIVPTTLASSLAAWVSFHEGVLEIDDDGLVLFTHPDPKLVWYLLAAAGLVVVALANLGLLVGAARQARATVEGEPEEWSISMRAGLRRYPRALGATALAVGLLIVLWLILSVSWLITPLLVLLVLPLCAIASVLVIVRFSLINIVAALAPSDRACLRTSWALTIGHGRTIFGRMALLTMFSVSISLLMSLVASPFVALAGGSGTTPVEQGATEIHLADVLGDNPAVFAIGQLFSALGNGAAMVLWTVGFVLLYRDLAGPVAADDGGRGDLG
jgi:hypothetical protein